MESIIRKRVARLEQLASKAPERGSLEWYRRRHDMLTASDVPTAMDENRYESSSALLRRKTKFMEASIDKADWVTERQPVALDIYRLMHPGEELVELSLISHPGITWLGSGSVNVTRSGKLVAVVAPHHRTIRGDDKNNDDEYALEYFWKVAQTKLEICNLNRCDFVQVSFTVFHNQQAWEREQQSSVRTRSNRGKFFGQTVIPAKEDELFLLQRKQTTVYWRVDTYKCDEIERDSAWFRRTALPRLKLFWKQLKYYKKHGLGELVRQQREIQPIGIRNLRLSNDNNKQQHIDKEWNEWVSASKVHNYFRSDCLLDWLNYYVGDNRTSTTIKTIATPTTPTTPDNSKPNYQQFIMERGVEFEDRVIRNLYHRFRDHIVAIASGAEAQSKERASETIDAMKRGVPIIYQAVLHDYSRKTYGMPDLLVRSDWLNRIVTHPCIDPETAKIPAPKLPDSQWHYRVIDIKLSTLRFNVDLRTLRNQGSIPCYKGQVAVYNDAVGYIQGYTPNNAYLLGRKWTCHSASEGFQSVNDPFDRLGVVDFTSFDYPILPRVEDAIAWIRRMRTEGHEWTLSPPSIPELYPNMNNEYDAPWHGVKKRLSRNNAEITALWHCGVKNREHALQYGIDRWTDPECTVETLGMTGPKRVPILEAILAINKSRRNDVLVLPRFIRNNYQNWKTKDGFMDFYVDIEAVNDVVMGEDDSCSLIFMIGVGFVTDSGTWQFRAFAVDQITKDEELRIILEFHDYVLRLAQTENKEIRLIHWGHYDRTMFMKKVQQYQLETTWQLTRDCWLDFLTVVKTEPVVVRGALNFGLKEVAKALYQHGLIRHYYQHDSVCSNGLNAMIAAWNCHLEAKTRGVSMQTLPLMKSVTKYNEMDCKLVWEIVDYLRSNHVSSTTTTIADIIHTTTTRRKRKRNPQQQQQKTTRKHKKIKIC